MLTNSNSSKERGVNKVKGNCSLTKFIYLCMRRAGLYKNNSLMLYPKVTDQIVKFLAFKYVNYLDTYCSQNRSKLDIAQL
jgi:hypothetical protein